MWTIKLKGLWGETLFKEGEKDPYVETSPAENTITDERYNRPDNTTTDGLYLGKDLKKTQMPLDK